jgi:hypothetical protein
VDGIVARIDRSFAVLATQSPKTQGNQRRRALWGMHPAVNPGARVIREIGATDGDRDEMNGQEIPVLQRAWTDVK